MSANGSSAPVPAPTSGPAASPAIREIREIVREEHIMRGRILKLLEAGALTIPEIAEALGVPTSEVTFWVMGMRKYGYVKEEKEVTDEGYFRYQAIEREI
jgi:predicted transcriptional regulator